jgi:chromate reductase, NAD(P)H dehydrogenase (quinone)
MSKARVLVFAGSARRDSLNKKLARVAAKAAEAAGGEVTFIDLDAYPMPVYHGDLEEREGMPANAAKLREIFLAHDALIIASPENNQSVSSLLKNTLDWLSRSVGDGKGVNSGLAPYKGKLAGLLAASPGQFGGVRGLPHLRAILSSLGVTVLGAQVAIARADKASDKAFDAAGGLVDAQHVKAVETLAQAVVESAAKLREAPDAPRIGQDH